MGNVLVVHDDLPDQPAEIPEGALAQFRLGGWHLPGEEASHRSGEYDGRSDLARQSEEAARIDFVEAYHPATGNSAQMPETAMASLRQGGWLLRSEWDAQQPQPAEDEPDDKPKGRSDGPADTAGSKPASASSKAAAGGSAGATDKEQ